MNALELFRGLAKDGGGMPVKLQATMEGVSLPDWKPLNRTVNLLFDDAPEPVQQKQEWKKKDWSKAMLGQSGTSPQTGRRKMTGNRMAGRRVSGSRMIGRVMED